MHFVTEFPNQEGIVEPIAREFGAVVINFNNIIKEQYDQEYDTEDVSDEAIDDFYETTTEKEPMFFVDQLLEDWIPWIELQGERVIGESPNNSYIIHSLNSSTELEYLNETFGEELYVIIDGNLDDHFYSQADIVINRKDGIKYERAIQAIIREFLS